MNFLTVSGVAETRCSSAACSFNTAIFIGFASIQAIRTMTRAVTATVMIVLHFNKATKPSYVRVASFRSPFDTIIYFLPCPENRGLFNHMCPAPLAHARTNIHIRFNKVFTRLLYVRIPIGMKGLLMAHNGTPRLMLIDDEPAQRRLIAALAARSGWRTIFDNDVKLRSPCSAHKMECASMPYCWIIGFPISIQAG